MANFFSFGQTIRRVNNNANVTGINVYATLAAAHTAAVAGDILYIEPSTTNYGSLTITKRLTIIGNGYDTNINTNTSMPFDTRTSQVTTLIFENGSANSVMMGFTFLLIFFFMI